MRLASYIDSQQSKKAALLIVKRRRPLGFLLFVVGVVYLGMLSDDQMSRGSFFDENALMAGLVRREFSGAGSILRFADEMKNLPNINEKVFMQWLETKFVELGLEVYSQNFTTTKPVSHSYENNEVSGRNLYGILRAGRSLGTESIILSTPYLTSGTENHHGTAVMLALIEYFKTKNYWAKDLIFLVTTGDEIGMQSWIDNYMGLHSTGAVPKSLPGRSGAIQAVINLEVPSASIQYAEIIAEGLNGILPNLDLVNVVVYLCQSERIEPFFHVVTKNIQSHSQQYYSLQTMVAIAFRQALGLPLANHALFLKHRIDSVTIKTVPKVRSSGHSSNDLQKLARALEGTFRSINNLLETLHHSEFFYFTISLRRFISIGGYMPPFGFLIAPVVLEALAQWLLARDPLLSSKTPDAVQTKVVVTPFPFQAVMKLLLVSFTSGFVLCAIPKVALYFQNPLKEDGLIYSLLLVCGISITMALLFRTKMRDSEWRMSKAIALILLMLTLVAVSLTNYSLAVFLAVALPLPAVLAQPLSSNGSKVLHLLKMVVVLLCAPPLCLVYFCSAYISLFSLVPNTSILQVLTAGSQLALEGTVMAYNSWHFVGSWIFFVTCTVVWPLWLMSWVLCSSRQEEHEKQHVD